MVMKLLQSDHAAIEAAITNAQQQTTTAKIDVLVRPASSHYQEFILLYGFILGSALIFALWFSRMLVAFPWLMAIQLSVICLVDCVPFLRTICMRCVPQRVQHHRAGIVARHDYHELQVQRPNDEPFVLLCVSITERYVHVFTNPVVHGLLASGWDVMTKQFKVLVGQKGLRIACVETVDQIAERLASHFPRKLS
jgi:uncharacterized membrane protein